MRALAPLLVLLFVMSGCAATPAEATPEEVARAALDRRDADSGPAGSMTGATVSLVMDIQGSPQVHVEVTVTEVFYRDDTAKMDLQATDVKFDGTDEPTLETLHLTLYCDPQRIVVETQGDDSWGGTNVDAETRNDASACLGKTVNEAQITASVQRIVATMGDGFAKGFVQSLLVPEPDSEYTVKSARSDGAKVRATYYVTDKDGTHEEDVVIEDGRIVEQSLETTEDGVRTAVVAHFSYGTRQPAPGVRGTDHV